MVLSEHCSVITGEVGHLSKGATVQLNVTVEKGVKMQNILIMIKYCDYMTLLGRFHPSESRQVISKKLCNSNRKLFQPLLSDLLLSDLLYFAET